MKPVEELLYRVATMEGKIKRMESDLQHIKKDNLKLSNDKKRLQETIKEKEKEEEISSGWFFW